MWKENLLTAVGAWADEPTRVKCLHADWGAAGQAVCFVAEKGSSSSFWGLQRQHTFLFHAASISLPINGSPVLINPHSDLLSVHV